MPTQEGPAEEQANAPVTREEFLKLMERIDGQSKYIARLEKSISGKSAASGERSPQAETNVSDPPGLREQVSKIAQDMATIRQEREALDNQKIIQSLSRSLQKRGVPAYQAEIAAEVTLNHNKESFSLGDDGEAVYSHQGESLTRDAWSSMYLASEKGQSLIPTKNGPSRITLPKGGNGNGSGRQVTITPEQLARGDFPIDVAPKDLHIAE